jgi:hypothetical protein
MSGLLDASGEGAATLLAERPPARMAFQLKPATIKALVPGRVPGTYLLLAGSKPIYVGRSDTCLRTRLARHNHLSKASHVLWEPASTSATAFALEAFWFHKHSDSLLNKVHPASPRGQRMKCPFCSCSTEQALRHALRRPLPSTQANV